MGGDCVRIHEGIPRRGPRTSSRRDCSAFAAAVAAQLGVELLHPPEHSQVMLADAQCAWLADQGRRAGWQPLESPLEAQQRAKRGTLVVACYASSDPELPGHIAVVRPEALSRRLRAARFYARETSVSGIPDGDPDAGPVGTPRRLTVSGSRLP